MKPTRVTSSLWNGKLDEFLVSAIRALDRHWVAAIPHTLFDQLGSDGRPGEKAVTVGVNLHATSQDPALYAR
jgi:hypothetical protein